MTDYEVEQHYVTFYSPGTFVPEETRQPINEWDVDVAVGMAAEIFERHNATPFGFRFTTRARLTGELDARQITQSAWYFLGGDIATLDELEAKADPGDRILIANMKSNGWDRAVINTNSWKWAQPLGSDDVVLDLAGPRPPVLEGTES